jgi:hypothetical protein
LTEGSSPERKLLTKKAQQTLRKIQSLKRLLVDNSVRAEIEKVLGKGDIESISTDFINNRNKEEEEKEKEKSELSSDRKRNQANAEMENVENADNTSAKKTSGKPPATNQEEPEQSENNQAQSVDERSQGSSSISRDSPRSKNVSFAAAVTGQNSHHMKTGNLQGSQRKNPPPNPYLIPVGTQNNEDQSTLHNLRRPSTPARPDKAITLKKNNSRQHIHRCTLRFKTIKAKSEDESHTIIQEALQRFLEIVLQADPKSIVPPYLELDWNDRSVSDLSSAFPVSSIDSYHVLKKYFFRLSPRDDEGVSWCSIILAQSLPFPVFMDKAKYSL